MLYNNHSCKLNSQYFVQLQRQCLGGQTQQITKVLLTLDEMFRMNPQMMQSFATEAYKWCLNNDKCTDIDWEAEYALFAAYGVLMSGVCLGLDIGTGKFDLYTSSISVLEGLATRGVLKGKKEPIAVELQKVQKDLYEGTRLKKTIKDGDKYCVVRLDPSLSGNKLQMTCTIPRSLPKVGQMFFVPFSAYKDAMESIYNMCQANILRVVMGDKVRDVTLNREILKQIYGEERTKYLCSFMPDMYMQKMYLPSVGASKYTPGVTNIKLDMVDSITMVSLADLNLTDVNVDMTGVQEHFIQKYINMSDRRKQTICDELGTDEEHIADIYPSTLWDYMKKYPQDFDVEGYRTKPSKFGSTFDYVSKPRSQKDLQSMLHDGAYRILISKKNGSFSTIYGTNSPKILRKFLGDDYYRKYESEGNRARYFMKLNEQGYSDEQAYQLTGIADLEMADKMLGGAYERTTVVKQNHLVTVRNLQVKGEKDFYKNVDLASVIEISKLNV